MLVKTVEEMSSSRGVRGDYAEYVEYTQESKQIEVGDENELVILNKDKNQKVSYEDIIDLSPEERQQLEQQVKDITSWIFSAARSDDSSHKSGSIAHPSLKTDEVSSSRVDTTLLDRGALLDGRYQVVRLDETEHGVVGGGEHGTIYAGYDKLLRQPVAIKASKNANWLRGDIKYLPRVSGLFPNDVRCKHVPRIFDYSMYSSCICLFV